jgi:hypothetical protein
MYIHKMIYAVFKCIIALYTTPVVVRRILRLAASPTYPTITFVKMSVVVYVTTGLTGIVT